MPDFSKPRHSAKVIAECLDICANFAHYLSAPFDADGNPLPDQPSPEESALLEVKAANYEADAAAWRTVAPDLPREDEG